MKIEKADELRIKQALMWKFRNLIVEYIEETQEDIKAGIISWLNEDMSKSKRNDRDLELLKLQLYEEFKELPERLLTLIENSNEQS